MDSKYKNPDHDPKGAWRTIVASAPDSVAHQGMVYAIQNPITGKLNYPPQGRHWSLGQDQMLEAMCKWGEYELRDLKDYEARAFVCNVAVEDVRQDVLSIVLKEDISIAQRKAMEIYKKVPCLKFFFSRNGKGVLSRKAYLQQMVRSSSHEFVAICRKLDTQMKHRAYSEPCLGEQLSLTTPKPAQID